MFLALILKVLPLYITVFIGFVVGKFIKLDGATIGKLLFYAICPTVVFFGILKADANLELMSLPIITFAVCCIMSFAVYRLSAFVFRDHTRNLLAFSSGSSSMGFFGLPVAIALFDDETVSIYLLCYVGMLFFENSFGFYIVTEGLYTPKQCIKRLIALPNFYATAAALILSHLGVRVPELLLTVSANMTSTYMILGTMLSGIAVANIKKFSIDWKLMGLAIFIKYVAWPVLVLSLIFLDRMGPQLYSNKAYQAFILLAIIPISATGVMIASALNHQPDKAAMLLLTSTIVGMLYVPLMISFLLY